jgi:glycosyltransferase involved in cell wall biosynthesis
MQNFTGPQLSVIIPAYNEEQRLPQTLDDVLAYLRSQSYDWEVVVVDDGSTDGTGGVVRERVGDSLPIRLLQHPDGANHGKGAAVRLGMKAATGRYRLFMDADNSTTLDHVERFWPWFDDGYDVVIGSRDVQGAQVEVHQPWYKELAGNVGNWIIRFLAVPGIWDTQAGFKMFSQRCIEAILPAVVIDHWGFDVELLVAARRRGFRVKEVPIRWVNAPNSKVRATTYFEVLGEVWRVRKNLRAGKYDED